MSNFLWLSDTHYHNFSQFSTVNKYGLNSRLVHTIEATKEAVTAAKVKGITDVIHGGDCFHTRGKISPTVLNPVLELYHWIIHEMGMKVYMIAGNHDLESRESQQVTNTASALIAVGVEVVNKTDVSDDLKVVFIPWHSSLSDLKAQLKNEADKLTGVVNEYTAVIHAPLNGVITGIPDHGLDAADLAKYGFKRIMCGHYHNHVDFGNVVSIGSLTHQNFGDIHSKAGFILEESGVLTHYETSAPKFIDLDNEDVSTEAELIDVVAGNFVRVKLEDATEKEVADFRNDVTRAGALGVVVNHVKTKSTATARTATTTSGVSMESSVSSWITSRDFKEHKEEIEKAALALLSEV